MLFVRDMDFWLINDHSRNRGSAGASPSDGDQSVIIEFAGILLMLKGLVARLRMVKCCYRVEYQTLASSATAKIPFPLWF